MYNAILCVGWEDLKPLTLMEQRNLTRPLSIQSPALTLYPNASIYFCLVYEDQLFGTEERYLVYVFVA